MTADQEEVEKWQHTRDWEVVMKEAERLAFDDLQLDSDTARAMEESQQEPTSSPHTPSHVCPHVLGSPMEVVVEVHITKSDLDTL